jgi:uncharacterized membrane protein
MRSLGSSIGAIAFTVCIVGYQIFIHYQTVSGQLSSATALLVLCPLIAAAGWATLMEFGKRVAAISVIALSLLSLILISTLGKPHPEIVFGLPHVASNLWLLWFFGRTLKKGRIPLVTTIATRVRGVLSPELVVYTRRVTLAWCIFFAAQIIMSITLYVFSTLPIWSAFINVLNFPLIVVMFMCEYAYRITHYSHHSRSTEFFESFRLTNRTDPTAKPPKGQ